MTRRTERLNALLRNEISNLILRGIKDPRISGVVSLTRVDVSNDLSYATVHVSIYGSITDKKNTLKALKSASGFMRRELLNRISVRSMPILRFKLDESIADGNEILHLINSLEIPPEPDMPLKNELT
ncbi:30S ribosome-binding factor RbfA [Dehalococcoidia bacterium]|nr:30S ribosome-binding factor RbfA [Dehalococcoidia bacterium]